jgi:hypothetical protein
MAISIDECIKKASDLAEALPQDVFVYNGPMQSGKDLDCIDTVFRSVHREECLLLLTTHGGDPDAAYKIARYLQEKYKKFSVLVSGRCKSAGTLLALGAHEIVFTPYGELGPLDIQMSKVDKFDQLQSGLTITDSLNTLEARALDRFYTMVSEYIQANNGLLSFASASKAAADFVTQLYAPVFARIDPEEVGAKARSMRIATDYGKRLAVKSQNLRPTTLKALSETYSSHSFVIDQQEAGTLFLRVRSATDAEREVVAALDRYARFEVPQGGNIVFRALSKPVAKGSTKGKTDGQTDKRGNKPANGPNPPGPAGAAKPSPVSQKRGSRSAVRRRGNGSAHP